MRYSLQSRKRGADATSFEAGDGGLAGTHAAGELPLTQPGGLPGVEAA